ncbi:choice-of-anchor tandem repeat GloVer-containing protein [Paraflavitalea sp. CAU 1676]|uniref:choice-of-anchor tandem repeat GloVer-containing protein n=1 Tax=Paraflavitalea sp. CAU 1676 TaxID=3032598 RepID=UPI0023DA043F|nr:choice-of-anchor tandem repeat GloVer-containing protein [Paraflavitalea sp. CAU 1676]MDF2193556.1 T9SS type A sorting domain-containing protein [Paraflavitalea sp. CAU 1676]
MTKRYSLYLSLSFLLCLSVTGSWAQGIYQFWGVTDYGGADDQGSIFSTRFDGTGHRMFDVFKVNAPGDHPRRQRPVLYNNKFYGVMTYGVNLNLDFIYEYDPATNKLLRKANLAEVIGLNVNDDYDASYTLLLYNNKFYGVSTSGGANDKGCIFEYNPANHQVTVKYSFITATGYWPSGELIAVNNKFYGMTSYGGNFSAGVLFEFDPATNVYAKKVDFNEGVWGGRPSGGLTLHNGMLYGATSYGTGSLSGGAIFRFNPANSTFSKRADMSSIGAEAHIGTMVVLDDKLYGITERGGAEDRGILFEFDPAATTLSKVVEMTGVKGYRDARLSVFNNKILATTNYGASDNRGSIVEYNPATNALSVKVYFTAATGCNPDGGMTLYNNRFYGFSPFGGESSNGVLFEYNPVANGYTKKLDLSTSATGFRPSGPVQYYKGKLYGTATQGGADGYGVVYAFDIQTNTYEVLHNRTDFTGRNYDQGGMILYNDKLYGVSYGGGLFGHGVLYSFDPATKTYEVKVAFEEHSGKHPYARLSFSGSKMYGTTSAGGNNGTGTIFEYNAATNIYTTKYHFPAGFSRSMSELALVDGKYWGTAMLGGANSRGVLFSWNPATNVFAKEFDLGATQGVSPEGGLMHFDNKLYGLLSGYSSDGLITGSFGQLYSYNPATHTMTIEHQFDIEAMGAWPRSTLTGYNGKIYGLCNAGGDFRWGGTLFEFDPNTKQMKKTVDFTGNNGRLPRRMQMRMAPAPVAPGHPGVCWNASEVVNVNNTNNAAWFGFTDSEGRAIAEINAEGNILGDAAIKFYTHNGATRKDEQGKFYLDRNFTVTVDQQPAFPVTLRLYITKAEVDKLVNTPGSGVLGVTNLAVFKNEDGCANVAGQKAVKIPASFVEWENGYVFTMSVSSFSSFYFASSSFSALPIVLESFKGTVKPEGNQLSWKANCTDAAQFTIERSVDGVNFKPVGAVQAQAQDCRHPFQFVDAVLATGSYYYRLRMEEAGKEATYSMVVQLTRGTGSALMMTVAPNPVVGNTAVLRTVSTAAEKLEISIHDMAGRKVMQRLVQVTAGTGVVHLQVGSLGSGTYVLQYRDRNQVLAVRFVKQ